MSDMTNTESPVYVPSLDQLLSLAEMINSSDEDLLEADFHDYSSDINEQLLAIREGEELTPEISKRLEELYEDWEEEGFPVDEVDYDALHEGDPDAYPDPEDI